MRDLILQLSKSSIYSTKPRRTQSNQQVKPPKLPRKKADPDKMD
ncbi:hypothetical protein (plasmid) [Citrobacter freundii]|uniref:Uncharacterized protein n=2 Tax=Enterobacteriaceae TaxID=543 RepID=A0A2R4NFL2_KLEPN|nr:hypothetical protein [Citrobacter freundii]AVX34944.1 hypothetical protein [Klebsiella pneumoniae]QEQ69446.1 hypothetical protein [Enterobacter cloacae]